MMLKKILLLELLLSFGVCAATPAITGVTAQQRYPWNGKVDISYTVTGDVTAGVPEWNRLVLSVSASNRMDGTSHVASAAALSGDTGTAVGVHHVVWDLDTQGLAFKSDEVVFSVAYSEMPYQYCVIDLSAGANASSYPVSYMAEPPSGGFNVDLYKTTKLVLRRIEPGSFMMCGQYDVTLTKPYYMGIFEVTQKQYELVTGDKPSRYKGDMRPVETAWGVPSAFRTRTGLDLGLPTEAQWEYACRAGTTSDYNNGGDTVDDLRLLGWFKGNSSYNEYGVTEHAVVGQKRPNAWGLYDMHGNVEEWCQDWFGAQGLSSGLIDPVGPSSGSVKILRGGNCFSTADKCTSSYRHTESPSNTSATWGFRLAWTLPSTSGTNNIICSGESAVKSIDLTSGTRTAAVTETIRYSTEWVENAPVGTEAVIAVNGESLISASGTGFVDWTPLSNGTYTLTHKVMSGETQYGTTLTATFLAEGLNPQTPVITPVSGTTFDGTLSVSISCPTEGATIHYTTDGSEPTVNSPVYRRFRITGKTTVKAIAEKYGMLSDVAVAEYAKGRCAEPVIDAAASFTGSKTKVALSCNTEDATIRYTLNGSDPNSHATRYAGPFYVTESCTVKAYATKPDYFDSPVVTQAIEKVWGIGDTMGKPDHGFTTGEGGGLGWTRVMDATAPDGEAMKSGAITHSQASVLSTTVMGPGTLSFAWRTSCEDDPLYEWDHVELVVDGTAVRKLCGETAWTNESVEIVGENEHTVEWRYVKDDMESVGEDAAWVANYQWASAWTATRTTAVPVPYAWLDAHDPDVVDEYAAYETSAKSTAANGRETWECYALGLDPSDPLDDFRITRFWMDGGVPMFEFNHTTDGSGNSFLPYVKPLGKVKLTDGWRHVPDGGVPAFRFFAAEVVPPGCTPIVDALGGVQLWENGPYWAECNVGATKPEEYGYYFWWGDTVGYTRSGGTWTDNYYSGVKWVSSTGTQMGSSPFTDSSCPTCGKGNAALQSAGYIDSTGNLVAAHDAATAHLGSPWRMPTIDEIDALVSKCTTTWISINGVSGRLVTGKGAYANRSIFLPAAGYGEGTNLNHPGSFGSYWSSFPSTAFSRRAVCLHFYSSDIYRDGYDRCYGRSVRPVRGSDQ